MTLKEYVKQKTKLKYFFLLWLHFAGKKVNDVFAHTDISKNITGGTIIKAGMHELMPELPEEEQCTGNLRD